MFSKPKSEDTFQESLSLTYVLWVFLGLLGAHRAYLGHWSWFVIYFFTLGGVGVLWLVDLFRIGDMVKLKNLESKRTATH